MGALLSLELDFLGSTSPNVKDLGDLFGRLFEICWQLLSIFSGVHLEISPSAPYPIIYNTKWPSGHAKSGAKSIKNRSKRASKSIRTVIEKIVEMGIDF